MKDEFDFDFEAVNEHGDEHDFDDGDSGSRGSLARSPASPKRNRRSKATYSAAAESQSPSLSLPSASTSASTSTSTSTTTTSSSPQRNAKGSGSPSSASSRTTVGSRGSITTTSTATATTATGRSNQSNSSIRSRQSAASAPAPASASVSSSPLSTSTAATGATSADNSTSTAAAGSKRRTRNQRLRAMGQDPDDQPAYSQSSQLSSSQSQTQSQSQSEHAQQDDRRVRFSMDEEPADDDNGNADDNDEESRASSATTTTAAARSRASASTSSAKYRQNSTMSRTKNSRNRKKPPDDWLLRDEDDDDDCDNQSSGSAGRTSAAGGGTHTTKMRLFSTSKQKVRGAGSMNVYAVQDSARCRALSDECSFLCSTLSDTLRATAAPSTSTDNNYTSSGNSHTNTKSGSALEVALDLAELLSDKKNRHTLLTTTTTTMSTADDDLNHPAVTAAGTASTTKVAVGGLQSILDVLACIPNIVAQRQRTATCGGGGDDSFKADDATNRTKRSRHRQQAAVDAGSCGNSTIGSDGVGRVHDYDSSHHFSQPLLEALSLTVYYLSLDCTLSDEASSKSASTARIIRRTILTHAEGMQGILYLILCDPVMQGLRGRSVAASVAAAEFGSPVPAIHVPDDASVTSSVGDSQSIASGGTPDSQASADSGDPTMAGRRRRKRRRLDHQGTLKSIPEGPASQLSFASSSPRQRASPANDDPMSPASTDSHMVKVRQQLDKIKWLVLKSISNGQAPRIHSCSIEDDGGAGCVALIAFNRIVAGKNENDEQSCIDGQDGNDGDNGGGLGNSTDEDDDNPLLLTNRLLGESGAIPLLAQAIADALAAVTSQLRRRVPSDGATIELCTGCLNYLHDRVSKLASLVDGACLLNESNRRLFCQEGFAPESGGYLVVGLISTLTELCNSGRLFEEGNLGEIGLEILRTLTSLTHENELAGKELETSLSENGPANDSQRGLDALVHILKVVIDNEGPTSMDKMRYDYVIFCLNTLTNVVESGGNRNILAEMETPGSDDKELFLTWLTRWLVSQTTSFQNAVVGSTFGSSPSKHASRQLDAQEDEKLVTAGNGFVFLACLMEDNHGGTDSDVTAGIRDLVLAQVPGDDSDKSITFMKNTLKAFCNFYHFSVGDLSVAVVAPVKKLIQQLEVIQSEMRRPRVVDDA
jgi:hypothetical protein